MVIQLLGLLRLKWVLSDWAKVSCGRDHTIAVKTNGTLWAWGKNNNGQVGDGTGTYRSSPVQIGSLSTWSSVSAGYYHSTSIKTDGTLWAWGQNTNGQLGIGVISPYSVSPVQVGSNTDWKMVGCGSRHSTGTLL